MKLTTREYEGLTIHFRKGEHEPSSDEQALAEVLEKKAYRRVRSGFDVKPGERWLDLGANIGAFALYCRLRGATAVCYEPDPECFEILKLNAPDFELHNAAFTAFEGATVQFRTSNNPDNRYRGTVMAGGVKVPERYIELPPVKNVFAGTVANEVFDGIKMDVEGSEGPLLDLSLLPRCSKLVMEYHTSRDASVAHLKKRLRLLRKSFDQLKYPVAYDRAIEQKLKEYRPRFDQLIFAWSSQHASR
jgi:FkbM family methyltransferase